MFCFMSGFLIFFLFFFFNEQLSCIGDLRASTHYS